MRAKTISLIVLTALAVALTGSALASQAIAAGPAIDQYVETLPDSGGDRPSNSGTNPDGTSSSSGGTDSGRTASTAPGGDVSAPAVPASEISKLRSRGTDGGAAAAAIVAISGSSAGDGSGVPEAGGSKGDELDGASGDTALAGALKILMAGGPGGLALPAILITVLAGGIVIAARRRNSPDGGA